MGNGFLMEYSEPFLALIFLFAVLVVIADLCIVRNRRERVAANHRAWWNQLRTATYSRLMSDAASGFYGFPTIGAVTRLPYLFHVPVAFVAVGMVGTGFLVAGALMFEPNPEVVINHALKYFAAPSAAVALTWLAICPRLLSRIARVSFAPQQALLICLLVASAILMWIVLMHMGTWFEWQQKRTPTAYGTEWFYAEAYIEYMREPAGVLISLMAGLIIGLPAALYIIRICFSIGCKGLRPILAPVLTCLMGNFATTRTGVYALSASLVVLLIGILGL